MKFERWIRNHTNHLTVITGILIVAGLGAKWLGAAAFSQWLLAIASVIAAIPVVINAIEALRYKTISIELLVSIAVIGGVYHSRIRRISGGHFPISLWELFGKQNVS